MLPASASSFRRNHSLLRAALAVAVLMVVVAALGTATHLRQLADRRTIVTNQNMATSIEQTIESTITTFDVILRTSAEEISRQMAIGNVDVPTTTRFFERQLKDMPDMSDLRATNERGDVIFGTNLKSPPVNIADRDYFISLRDNPNTNTLLNRYLVGRTSKQMVWLFARRINKSDGSFGGVVFTGIAPSRIEALFSLFRLDSGGSISLRDADLVIIARHTSASITDNLSGEKRLSTPFIETLKANPLEGNYVSGATSIDGISRFHAYRRNMVYGFVVNVGSAGENALAEWRKQTIVIAGFAGAFISVSLIFAYVIGRAWRRQEDDLEKLSRSEKELYEAEKIANLGRYTYDLRSNWWTSSDILDGIFGIDRTYPRDAEHWLKLIAPDSRQEMRDYLKTLIEQRQDFNHEYSILRQNTKEKGWVHGKGRLELDAQGNPIRLIGTIQDITERKQIEEQMRQLAFYDPLTKLANRRLLNDRLSQAMIVSKRTKCYGALLFLDLDNFKVLNDRHGHEIGDLLLIEVADRLRNCVREMDTIARFGGDEFVVMISDLGLVLVEATAQAGAVAEKIRTALAESYVFNIQHDGIIESTVKHRCSTSIGVVVFINNKENQDDILKQADQAMYQAKEAGRNLIRFYDPNDWTTAKAPATNGQ